MQSNSPSNGGTNNEEEEQKKHNDFLCNFSPNLIHRILLTDPVEFPNLTMSGIPRIDTPSFEQFTIQHAFNENEVESENSAGNVEADKISKTMRKVYHDMILNNISTNKSYKPLGMILMEIHQLLRSLLPNRKDLHSKLTSDDEILRLYANDQAETDENDGQRLVDYWKLLKIAAESLVQLESEDRSTTTQLWLEQICSNVIIQASNLTQEEEQDTIMGLNRDQQGGEPTLDITLPGDSGRVVSMPLLQLTLASTLYIHHKAEMCQTDIADFQLGHIFAPRIFSFGTDYLKRHFELQCTNNNNNNNGGSEQGLVIPNTKVWIKEMIKDCGVTKDVLRSSEEKRGEMILCTGWVDNIIFRSPRNVDVDGEERVQDESSTPFLMPEVFYMDMNTIQQIRLTTKFSVVGSALALHACTAAGVGDSALQDGGDTSGGGVEECRKKLVEVMGNRMVGGREVYEKNIGSVVLELARVLNPSLSSNTEEMIRNRTTSVLRGQDPVLTLLDNRMRTIFREMMLWSPQQTNATQASIQLRTGRTLSLSKSQTKAGGDTRPTTYASLFKEAAKREFSKKGFAFYGEELAEANLVANRVINLVLSLHGSPLLETLVFNECQ